MYYCSLCRALQPIGTIRYRWSDKTSTAILISCFVKLDFLTLDDAKVIYDDIRSDLKYVCNDHYVEALLFLADEIEQRWETFPLELIDDVPVMIIRAVIRQIQGNISSFDVNVRLEAKHIRAFFKGCLTRYGPEVQRRRPSSLGATHVNVDDDNDALPYSLETPSPDCVEQTEGAEHSGIDVPGPSATVKEEDISQSIEECRSSLGDPMCEGDEDGARLDGPHCTLCGVCRTEGDMRVLSSDVPQSVIIIGSLCNSNMIDIETARRTYNEVQLRNGKFCKEHFIDAARYISREVQRLWGSYPGHGFQVPSSVRMDCVLFFEKIARSLGERVKLNENDLIRFYNDCMEKYHKKICWRHMQDPPESRENSPSSSRTSQFPTSETATMHHGESESCLLSSKGKRLNISPSENDTSVKKPKRQKDYYCAVCSCFRPAEDCREASLPDLLIVIACMAMDYKIDVHTKAKLGEEILYGWRFLCKQHYIEAATFIYCDVKQNGESLSERNFTCLSDLTKYSLCERIEKHWDLIDTRLVVRDDEISCFFNDCQTRYNIVQVAEERSTTESKEERMQASVASVVDEVVAQSSSLNTSRSTTEGFSIMSANESETPALWSNRGMDQVKNDTWLSSEVEFGCPDSSNLHRKLEVCQRVATNPKRAQRCGICDQMRSVDSLRRMTSTRNLRVILLSLLLKQNLIAVIVAKQAYKSGSGLYVCHEHFIQAGAFLVSKFEEKFGGFDMFGLRKLLDSFVSDMVHTINLFGELITDTAKPKATDVHIFLNDYDRRYRKNIDWKIREIPMGNTSVAAEPSSVNSAELLNAKEESSVPFNPDVSQDGYEEQLFSSKHETNDASPCLIANDQEDPNVMGRLPETHTSKSPSCTSMDFVGDECQSADSQFEAEMFKEISVTDLLQSDYIAGDVPEDHSKDISMLVNGNIKSEEQVNISDLDRDCDGEGRFDEYIEEPSYGSVDSVQDELRRRRTQSVGEKSYSSLLFLADEIEQRWETFPLELIDDVPVMIVRAVIRQIQGNISFFDVNVRLESEHIRAFFKGCLTRYGPEVQRRRPSYLFATHVNADDDNDALPYSQETPSPDCVEQTEGAEHSGIDVPGPSATVKEEDISQSIEECRSYLGDPMCEGDEDGARLDGPHCTLCGVCRTEGDMRVLSGDVPQIVIIIGSLCNSNIIDFETARRTYNEVQLRNGKFCKEHFIDAARYISREVQRLWGSYPGHGFQVPSSVRMDCVLFFQKFARSLEKRVKPNEIDLIRFYNDCMEKHHKEVCWRHVQVEIGA
nr:unnamed protein product [Haemonchus contortus]